MTSQPPPSTPPSPSTPSSMQPPAPPRPPGGPDVFTRIRALGIVRPDEGRWAAGVAAGLARRWGVDPLLVRGAFVALSLFGVGLFLYGAGWLLLPHPDGRIHAQEVTHGTVTAGFVGSVVAILAGMPFGGNWSGDGPGFGWSFGPGVFTLAIVGAVAWWLFHRRERPVSSTAAPASSSSTFAGSGTGSSGGSTGSASAAYEPPVTHA
ncbi:MAG: PspC domain-containing protein, partial [Kineosporiaceae bacterium]